MLIKRKIYIVIMVLSVCAHNACTFTYLAPPVSVFDTGWISALEKSSIPLQKSFGERFIKEYGPLYGPEFIKVVVELIKAGNLPHFAMQYLAGFPRVVAPRYRQNTSERC